MPRLPAIPARPASGLRNPVFSCALNPPWFKMNTSEKPVSGVNDDEYLGVGRPSGRCASL